MSLNINNLVASSEIEKGNIFSYYNHNWRYFWDIRLIIIGRKER